MLSRILRSARVPVVSAAARVPLRTMCTVEFALSQHKAEQQAGKQQYPVRDLTKRERDLEARDEQLPPMADHGFRFFTLPHQVDARSEAVKRALSTRTASQSEMRQFRRHQYIRKFRTHMYDTGSARVVVALLTERIEALQRHLKTHNHDKMTKKRLQGLVSRRRRLMRYMVRNDYQNYRVVVKELGLRPVPLVFSKYPTTRGRSETHKAIHLRNSRVKNRKGRGHLGH